MSHTVVKRFAGTSTVIRTQRIMGKSDIRRPAYILFLFISILSVVFAFIFYIWIRLEVIRAGYDIAAAHKEQVRLVQENKELRIAVSDLRSPKRIERIARDRLNLHYPKAEEVVKLR